MDTVTVNAKALHDVLQALVGSPHHIRELQVTRNLPVLGNEDRNPINVLLEEFNAAVQAHEAKEALTKSSAPSPA